MIAVLPAPVVQMASPTADENDIFGDIEGMPTERLTDEQSCLAGENTRLVYYTITNVAVVTVAKIREQTGYNNDEIASELWPIYLRAIRTWTASKGTVATYVVFCLTRALRNFASRKSGAGFNYLDDEVKCFRQSEDAECEYNQERQRIRIEKAFGVLTEQEKRVVRLRFFAGTDGVMTYDQIGEAMGFSHQRAKQLMKSASAKLREILPETLLTGEE